MFVARTYVLCCSAVCPHFESASNAVLLIILFILLVMISLISNIQYMK